MLSAGNFPLPCTSKSLLTTTHSHILTSTSTSSSSLSLPLKTNPNPSSRLLSLFSLASSHQFCRTHLKLSPIGAQRTNGSRASASKKKQGNNKKSVGHPVLDMEGLGLGSFDDELGGDYGDAFDDEDDQDDDGSVFLPFEKMNKWLENKPRGFGEGKVYDTRIEDQLLDEMRQSREAQAANVNKLKKNPLRPESKLDEQEKKANELVPNGVRVRVTNLPRKKNIHRDLSTAFKGVPGMISINPVVSGNKKTRDPICKGFAFVYFKSEKDADRFVEMFSRQSVAFGKMQKQIKCDILGSKTSDSAIFEQSIEYTCTVPEIEVEVLEDNQSTNDSETDDSFVDEFDNSIFVEFDDPNDEVDVSDWEDDDENLNSVTMLELNDSGNLEQRKECESVGDVLCLEMERTREPEKRLLEKDKDAKVPKKGTAAKGKEVKVPKLDIPGSAKRLKVKEKAVLTDVFSKYGQKSAMASKKER